VIDGLQRRARDENGNNILVPKDMTYEQWSKKYKPKLTLEQGSINNKKEKMNWQEQNEKMESLKIKPILYSNKTKTYRINKYQDKIMQLYQNNGNENMCILNSETGELVGIRIVKDNDDVMMITDTGTVIRLNVKEISVLGRPTQGVTLMRTSEGKVVSIEVINEENKEMMDE